MHKSKSIVVIIIAAVIISIAGMLWNQNMPNSEKNDEEVVYMSDNQFVGEVVKVRKRDGNLTAVVRKGDSTTIEANLYDESIGKDSHVIVKKSGDSYQIVGTILK